jgi:hypothetical protein
MVEAINPVPEAEDFSVSGNNETVNGSFSWLEDAARRGRQEALQTGETLGVVPGEPNPGIVRAQAIAKLK